MSERVRVLIVDQDEAGRIALRRALDRSGLDVDTEDTAELPDLLRAVSAKHYDCLVIAHDLPGATGTDVTKALRDAGHQTPVLLVIDDQSEELLDAAVAAGVTDFLLRGDQSPRRLALRIQFAIRTAHAEVASVQSLARATQATRARDDVLAVVSHDLRGPLHAISLATEALRDEVKGDGVRYLGAIERAGQRAERLIRDLLEASAIENGALQLAKYPVDAGAIVRQSAADHELIAKEAGGSIAAELPREQVLVSADRDRVLQVLGNLIGNALKHARGAPIAISLASQNGDAVISVRDRGPGIAAQELPHVFDRYWSGRTKKGGAGLGLAIAKGIVDAHGGTLSVESQHGDGATFSFTLPLAPRRGTDAR
jgi:signal transduction histidine kinase